MVISKARKNKRDTFQFLSFLFIVTYGRNKIRRGKNLCC